MALLLAVAGCHRAGPPGPAPSAALARAGLEPLVGQRVRGDSLAIRGARLRSSWLVSSPSDSGVAWSLQHLVSDGRPVILLRRAAAADGGLPLWVVTDAGYLPALPESFHVAATCRRGETADPRLFAVARQANTPELTDIRWAWIANLATGRVDTTGTAGIHCRNEGLGAD